MMRYCFIRPQYLLGPLSQQPVRMQICRLARQISRQFETVARANLTQLLLQVFSSPVQRIGSASAVCAPNRINPAASADVILVFIRFPNAPLRHCAEQSRRGGE
jgi:hypothetical protein